MKQLLKSLYLASIFGKWPRRDNLFEGYTVLLPMPEDMPFLLKLALESLSEMDLSRCREVLVIPDGVASPERLQKIVGTWGHLPARLVELSPFERLHVNLPRRDGGANFRHWMTIIKGIAATNTSHVYLHDADAFWLSSDALEAQYEECLARGLDVLGVTARWDPFFVENGYQIPGTWELLFSTQWARSRPPWRLKSAYEVTPHGPNAFDTMLYVQFLDYGLGKIALMRKPPQFVHFNGTITTFRVYQRSAGKSVTDELFRLLLISMLEELSAVPGEPRILPEPRCLTEGLSDPSAQIRYDGMSTAAEYPEFRNQVSQLCAAVSFTGEKAKLLEKMLVPFDDHFARRMPEKPAKPKFRTHGLG